MSYSFIEQILEADSLMPDPFMSGTSREGKEIHAFRFGNGRIRLSLIAGCHADEPTGPALLRKLICFLSKLESDHAFIKNYSWYIVPHANPDGEARNLKWYDSSPSHYDIADYLTYAVRELPGDDVEFGFPAEGKADALRPENQFVYDFWKTAGVPFHLHASLHGMAIAFGPWFLIEDSWKESTGGLQLQCLSRVESLGYFAHDVDRKGEKGFFRIGKGFCTRPDSGRMKAHFLALGDADSAARFHPSSMESIRSLGGDCFTMVSEMPLFLLPYEERELGWPDPVWDRWVAQLGVWRFRLQQEKEDPDVIRQEAAEMGIRPMPVKDQMRLQWQFVSSAMELIS